MKTKLLLVEDDFDLGYVIKHYLEMSEMEVDWFQDPAQLNLEADQLNSYHLAILDVNLPNEDGFTLSKRISKSTNSLPFLFLTAKAQSMDRILGLKLGAQDYIVKPCEPEELLLRIKLILNRKFRSKNEVITIGSYQFQPSLLELRHAEKTFQLTEKESELLLLLVQHNHSVLSRKEILEKVWGDNDYFLGRSLDVFMTRLRKYLSNDASIKLETIRGIGVRIEF